MEEEKRVKTDITLVILKKFSSRVVQFLIRTPITPNQVSIVNFIIFAPLSAYLFFTEGYVTKLLGVGALVLYSFFDLVDGELARKKNMLSKIGGWLEDSLDGLLQIFILLGITAHTIVYYDGLLEGLSLLPLIGQSLANVYGLRLEYVFAIDPFTGNSQLNKYVSTATSPVDHFLRNMMVPTDGIYILLFTLRFYVLFGAIFNMLSYMLVVFGAFITLRSLFLYLIFTLHYSSSNKIRKYAIFKYLQHSERKRLNRELYVVT